jgi:hypothetical protein
METSLQNFSKTARRKLVAFLWRQWSALGVAGGERGDDLRMIDPEALLLFSTTYARLDARLFDKIIDWLEINGTAISLVRLSRMHQTEGLGDATVLAALAEFLGKKSVHLKWQSLQKNVVPHQSPQPLFDGIPVLGTHDPAFLKWGWQREKIMSRGMSHSPRPDQPGTFLFQLRGLFGRQARAEVVAWLLSHESGHPARIAKDTSYYNRTVQQLLNEMEAGGHVRSFRQGREKMFSIRQDEWRHLIRWGGGEETVSSPAWINWAPLFSAIETLVQMMENSDTLNQSEGALAVRFRETLEKTMPALQRAGVATGLTAHPRMKGKELVDTIVSDVIRLLNF